MRVVVEGGDFIDLWQKTLVDLLNIGTVKWTGLSGGKNCRKGVTQSRKPDKTSKPCQFHISLWAEAQFASDLSQR